MTEDEFDRLVVDGKWPDFERLFDRASLGQSKPPYTVVKFDVYHRSHSFGIDFEIVAVDAGGNRLKLTGDGKRWRATEFEFVEDARNPTSPKQEPVDLESALQQADEAFAE